MDQRNWTDLDRKLVDKTDLIYTVQAMEKLVKLVSVSMWGPGVLVTSVFPSPFPFTAHVGDMGVVVGNGIGFDTLGDLTAIGVAGEVDSNVATPAIGHATLDRWDVLVIEYAKVSDTPIPKPSNPLTNVALNLHDDFTLVVVPGTPSGVPSYPAYAGTGFILGGLKVPAGSTVATSITFDFSIRDYSRFGFGQQPVFNREIPIGLINGVNVNFSLTHTPITNASLSLFLDGVRCNNGDYTLTGQNITFTVAPAMGQVLWAGYVQESPNSQNPLQANSETPTGTIDGVNLIFTLAGFPIYQAATDVYIDGIWIDPSQWVLGTGQGSPSKIIFNSGSQPTAGQSLEVVYWLQSWPNVL